MVVAATDDVAPRIGEPPHHVEVTAGGGPVHGVALVATLTRVRIESARQQQIDDGELPLLRRGVEQGRVRVEQVAQRKGVSHARELEGAAFDRRRLHLSDLVGHLG